MSNLFNDSMKEALENNEKVQTEDCNCGICEYCIGRDDKKSQEFYPILVDSNEAKAIKNINIAHKKYMKAKYDLYKKRSEMYLNKSDWESCKEQSGKNTDGVFREYVRNKLATEMEKREKAEFEYEQAKRVYSLL